MTAAGSPPLPAVIGGRYRPLRLIARGGMGAVYEVEHLNTGEHLALKLMLARSLLRPELVERFRREARIQSAVKSEHVVRVVDADVAPEIDGAPFLVMELLQGKDFERICDERQPSSAEVVDWLRQAGQALDAAHEQKIVHRDLKPENIFLAERQGLPPIVKVLDFGVAKLLPEGDGGTTGATQTGQILGTPRYMAPEQASGAKKISPASDRFALGLIAFRLLSGRHYFEGDNWVTLLQTVTKGPTAPPSELGYGRGGGFDGWFARACAFEPGARFGSCAEQIDALAAALAGASMRARRVAWRRSSLVALGAVAGTVGVAVAWNASRSRSTQRATGPETAAPTAPVVAAPAVVAPAPEAAHPDAAATQPARAVLVEPPPRHRPRPARTAVDTRGAEAARPQAAPPETAKLPTPVEETKVKPKKDSIWEEP
jgi:serine/threonine-protein kinase